MWEEINFALPPPSPLARPMLPIRVRSVVFDPPPPPQSFPRIHSVKMSRTHAKDIDGVID